MSEELQPTEKRTRKAYSKSDIENFLWGLKREYDELFTREQFLQDHQFNYELAAVRQQREFIGKIKLKYETHFDITID